MPRFGVFWRVLKHCRRRGGCLYCAYIFFWYTNIYNYIFIIYIFFYIQIYIYIKIYKCISEWLVRESGYIAYTYFSDIQIYIYINNYIYQKVYIFSDTNIYIWLCIYQNIRKYIRMINVHCIRYFNISKPSGSIDPGRKFNWIAWTLKSTLKPAHRSEGMKGA